MNLSFFIARRYLFAKKSHNAINVISMISVCGVAVATVAMVCVLSVFNGFGTLVASMFGYFDPELKITPAKGKVFDPQTEQMMQLRAMPEIAICTEVLEDNVLVRYANRQEVALAKGVEQSFAQAVQIDTLLLGGQFVLQEGETSYAIPGIGLAYVLGVQTGFVDPLEVLVPKRDAQVNPANPISSFHSKYAFVGGVFCTNQPSYDEKYIILPIEMIRHLLHYETEVSALELKLSPKTDIKSLQKRIRALLGNDFKVQDRYEQQEASYKMMQVEKWMSFLILAFVLAIALFNVISSLYMLMIEKQTDVQMLRSMGASNSLIRRIFLTEGAMIPAIGALTGVVIGILLCLIQQHIGVVKLGNTLGSFVSDNYPVNIELFDIILIFMTIFILGMTAAWYPVRHLGQKWQKQMRLVIWLLPLLLCNCKGAPSAQIPSIAVTIEPQRYFAEKIAGESFTVYSVIPSGQSPETYDPSPHEMVRISQSQAYLQIGCIGFEQAWMDAIRKNNPQLAIYDLSEGIDWIENTGENADATHNHRHSAHDPHIWTSTKNAKVIAYNVLNAIVRMDKANETTYRNRWRQLMDEINETEQTLHAILDTLTHRTFVIYHPALAYFADEFRLTQLAIETDGKEPSAASMKMLVDSAKVAHVQIVFVQQEFDRKHAEQLAAEINARVVVIHPLDKNWREQLTLIAHSLCNK